jgi:hypothetical protein
VLRLAIGRGPDPLPAHALSGAVRPSVFRQDTSRVSVPRDPQAPDCIQSVTVQLK